MTQTSQATQATQTAQAVHPLNIPAELEKELEASVVERFMRYVQIDTQSDPHNEENTPSTSKQFDLSLELVQELMDLGLEATVTEHAYVIAHLPASEGCESADGLGLIAHLDTAPDAPGTNVRPRIITYTGGDITLEGPAHNPTKILAARVPELAQLVGQDLIVTDGTTLLGSDDKAGVAEIMELVRVLVAHPEYKHPRLSIAFTPDEEISHGADLLDIPAFGARYAFTVDGGAIGELEYENFNAADMRLECHGVMIHPGSAKDAMVNALHMALDFDAMLPAWQRPEHTEGKDGFYHLMELSGTVDHAVADYIIRDHSSELFEQKKEVARRAVALLQERFGQDACSLTITDAYYNMKSQLTDVPELLEAARQAYEAQGFVVREVPIRGGTDGARLSFKGLPCPNLSIGGFNFHSRAEFIPVRSLSGMVRVLMELVSRLSS